MIVFHNIVTWYLLLCTYNLRVKCLGFLSTHNQGVCITGDPTQHVGLPQLPLVQFKCIQTGAFKWSQSIMSWVLKFSRAEAVYIFGPESYKNKKKSISFDGFLMTCYLWTISYDWRISYDFIWRLLILKQEESYCFLYDFSSHLLFKCKQSWNIITLVSFLKQIQN